MAGVGVMMHINVWQPKKFENGEWKNTADGSQKIFYHVNWILFKMHACFKLKHGSCRVYLKFSKFIFQDSKTVNFEIFKFYFGNKI